MYINYTINNNSHCLIRQSNNINFYYFMILTVHKIPKENRKYIKKSSKIERIFVYNSV